MTLKLGIQHRLLKYNQICSNVDTVLTLTIFITWASLFRNASAWVKAYTAYSYVFPTLFKLAHPMHSGGRYRTIWFYGFSLFWEGFIFALEISVGKGMCCATSLV